MLEHSITAASKEAEVTQNTGVQAYQSFKEVYRTKLLQALILIVVPGACKSRNHRTGTNPQGQLVMHIRCTHELDHPILVLYYRTIVEELQPMKIGC